MLHLLSGQRAAAVLVPAVAAVCGLLLGALTAYGQEWLPDALRSVANSAGSWSLVAFALATAAPRRTAAVVVGPLSLLALLAGYVLAAAVRGDASSTRMIVFWGLAAVVVGPFIGLAAHAVRAGTATAAAVGAGGMAGLLVGEGAYGLLYIADTTYPPYWWGSILAGVLVLVWVGARRLRHLRAVALSVAVAAVTAAAFVVVYSRDLLALFG
ncbi:DUF6518 family protein [Pseudonocardia nigra]|uniref:DUF6518 family protein n=1 Tax=Pseudonocardia nigra TaxID=1921578 RepID=UPI001C5CEB12|nr:DUF6518 family protein [Pseudonocardia nigra]